MIMKIVNITKRYSRKISKDWQSWEFSCEYSADVAINNEDELKEHSTKLFKLAYNSVMDDIDLVKSQIKPKSINENKGEKNELQ